MSPTIIRRARIHASWLMAFVLTVTLLLCHMAFGQVHQMVAGHGPGVSAAHAASPEPAGDSSASLTAADFFAVLLVAVLVLLVLPRVGVFRTRRIAAGSLRFVLAVTPYASPVPRHQRAGPALYGVFRL